MEFIGAPELLIVLLVVLLVFGPTRLPKLARSLGEAIHHFRRADDMNGTADETTPLGRTAGAQSPERGDSFR